MGNIRDLDALHQVMKGDITLDKAMAIGEVSHRKDGDYRKVAQGKWVPVKAGGKPQQQGGTQTGKKASESEHAARVASWRKGLEKNLEGKDERTRRDMIDYAKKQAEKYPDGGALAEAIREIGAPAGGKKTFEGSGSTEGHKWEAEKVGDKYIMTHNWPDGKTDKFEISQKQFEEMKTTQVGSGAANPKAEPKKHTMRDQIEHQMGIIRNRLNNPRSMADYSHQESDKANLKKYEEILKNPQKYNVSLEGEYSSDRWDDIDWDGKTQSAEQQGGGTNPAYKTFEENYAEAAFGKNEAEKMGWKMADVGAYPFWDSPDGKYRISAQHKYSAKEGGVEYELREKDTGRIIGRYPTLLDALRKKIYKTTDSAAPRLTRDTKIKLSQIKREQTQDERRFYKPGEISQKTGLQKQQDGSWAPPKQGRGSAYQESDKKVEALRGRGFNRTQLKNMRTSELDNLYEREMGAPAGGNGRTDGGLVWRSPDNKHRIHEDNSSGKTKYNLYERGDNYSRIIGEYDSPEAAVAAGEKINAPAGGKAEVNPITGKPMRPETVAYAKQKKAEAEQKRNTEKTAGGFTLAGTKKEVGNKPEPIALNEREQGEANRVMENLKNFDEKYTDRTKVRMKPGKNNHWDVFYGGKKIATMIGSVMQRDTAKKMGWFGEKG